jgi:hypothetical protein
MSRRFRPAPVTLRGMEAHVVLNGAIRDGEVPLADLRSTVSGLDEGAWVWVDDIRVVQSAHQLNEVMKKLTAWAAIILVPTLVAGIYGMNVTCRSSAGWSAIPSPSG